MTQNPASHLHTIMLPVRGDGKGDNVLAHAAVLARRHGARVRVVHCRPAAKDFMPYGVVIPNMMRSAIEDAIATNSDVTEAGLISEFKILAAEFGLIDQSHEPGKPTARFIEYEGKQTDAIKQFGRLADIICVPQPDGDTLGANTLKTALFSSGRPVMMCPPVETANPNLGDHLAIAWNGSIEASRAVGLSMPLIRSANQITILSSEAIDHAATAADLQRYLELKGVASETRSFKAEGSVVGPQLLNETKAVGADTLIMGAYNDSYERETLFGGNSQFVVQHSTIPIIMVH